ncbi:hypothetical protein ACFQ3S_05505 [Mucilaginibacter terrae]|uniref:hypothetical protein n=1 Tax=Mucilaginibacter terrae TaxID=1955052 RepID=UPI00362C1BB7
MKAETFVKEVLALKPDFKDFAGLEYSISFIESQVKEFEINKISNHKHENEIFNLILNYDVSSLSINDITFDSKYQEDEVYYYVGHDVGPDRIVINKLNGNISAIEPFSGKHMFHCAENAEKFFDALLEVMKFSKEKMLNDYSEEQRDSRAAEAAYIAALKAGGEEYEDYYRAVLWLE